MSSAIAVICGSVSDDPSIITSKQDGKEFAKVRLGWSRKVKGETKWSNITVIVFGQTVDVVKNYVKKGSAVCVTGELQEETWEKEGVKHRTLSMTCMKLSLEGKPQGDEKPQEKAASKKPAAKAKNTGDDDFPSDDDGFGDVPF